MTPKPVCFFSILFFFLPLKGFHPTDEATFVICSPVDEYTNHIPNPKHTPKYTKAKVPCTQDKYMSAEQLHRAPLVPLPPYKKAHCHKASQSMLMHTHY